MHKQNEQIRTAISTARVRYWQVAEAAGISAGTLTLWLRTPLTASRKQRVEEALEKLKQPA